MPDRRTIHHVLLPLLVVLLLTSGFLLVNRIHREWSPGSRPPNEGGAADPITTRSAPPHHAKLSRRPKAASYGRDCDAWFAEVLARHPGLEPEWRSVPAAANGFLQLLDFAERHRVTGALGNEQLPLPDDLLDILSGRKEWSSQDVATALAGHQELIEEISQIGSLPAQSAAGIPIDRYSFVGARLYKQCTDLLLADARLAIERGDTDVPRERIRAALGIARHMSDIESPSILMESVAVLIRLQVDDYAMQHLLPAQALDREELAIWQHELESRKRSPEDFANTLRGEAYLSIRGLAIPALVGDTSALSKHDIPDPDAFIDASIGRTLRLSRQAEDSSIEDLATTLSPDVVELPEHLSPGALDAYKTFYFGASSWSKGWARAISIQARTEAAFAIAAGAEPPVEPITGLPFVFDSETRTLSHPEDPRLELIRSAPVTVPPFKSE